jgi:hypothetical protein
VRCVHSAASVIQAAAHSVTGHHTGGSLLPHQAVVLRATQLRYIVQQQQLALHETLEEGGPPSPVSVLRDTHPHAHADHAERRSTTWSQCGSVSERGYLSTATVSRDSRAALAHLAVHATSYTLRRSKGYVTYGLQELMRAERRAIAPLLAHQLERTLHEAQVCLSHQLRTHRHRTHNPPQRAVYTSTVPRPTVNGGAGGRTS